VDTTAEALVRTGYDNEGFLVFILDGFGFGFLEDGVRGFAIAARFTHSALGASQLGRGDDFHRLGDFLDVFDGFETLFDLPEGGIVGGVGSHGPARKFMVSGYS